MGAKTLKVEDGSNMYYDFEQIPLPNKKTAINPELEVVPQTAFTLEGFSLPL